MVQLTKRLEKLCSVLADDLKAELHGLKQIIDQLEHTNIDLEKRVSGQQRNSGKLDELKQNNARLEETVASLQQNNAELRQALDSAIAEQHKTKQTAKQTSRRIKEQQVQINEQEHFILQVQAENDTLKNKLANCPTLENESEFPLPSSEAASDAQEYFSVADLSTPRSTTFAGDEVQPAQFSAGWFNVPNGTPVSLRGNGRVVYPKLDGKTERNIFVFESANETEVFKKPQLPQRPMETRTPGRENIEPASANRCAEAMDDVTNADGSEDAYTPNKRLKDGYYTDNIVLRDRSVNVQSRKPRLSTSGPAADHVQKAQRFLSSPDPISLDAHALQIDSEIDVAVLSDDMQADLDALNEQFKPRTGAMQLAASSSSASSGRSAGNDMHPVGNKYYLRGQPRKSVKFQAEVGDRGTEGYC